MLGVIRRLPAFFAALTASLATLVAAPADAVDTPLLQAKWPFNQQVFTTTSPRFAGTVSDPDGVASLTLTVRDTSTGVERTRGIPLPRQGFRLSPWETTLDLAPGGYRAVFTVTDTTGASLRKSYGFTVDPDAAPGGASYVTMLMSRAQWVDAPQCVPTPGGMTLGQVADAVRGRGWTATTSVVFDRQEETTRTCQAGFQINSSWDDLRALRGDGWGFAVHYKGEGGANLPELTPEEQRDATCGDLARMRDRGFTAWGLFAYNSANTDATVQTDVVSQCFAYGRRYDSGVNPRSSLVAPWFLSTISVNGGYCNDPALPCFDLDVTRDGQRYQTPDELAARLRGYPETWTMIQFYRFVRGANTQGPGTHYDCRGPVEAHWTAKTEVYCWADAVEALTARGVNVEFTSPTEMATRWGRGNPGRR